MSPSRSVSSLGAKPEAKKLLTSLAFSSLLALTACMGGGGGGSSGASPTSSTGGSSFTGGSVSSGGGLSISLPPISGGDSAETGLSAADFETSEYIISTGLSRLNASSAYAAGATGQGITVAVVDTGLDLEHADFAGAVHSASVDIVSGRNELDDVAGHGTLVAGTIGARRNGQQVHGIAYNSQILAIRADSVIGNCQNCFTDTDIANATRHATQNGARVINYSLAGEEMVSQNLLDDLRAAASANVVLVAAAGNNYGAAVEFPAALVTDAQIAGRMLAVGSVDSNNNIANFSARPSAGGAQYFVVTPGQNVLTTASGGYTQSVNGTSFSSGYVSGAVALLLSHAPYLSAQQVVQLILSTTTDLGAAGVDTVYGAGLVNVEAALAPAGPASVPTGDTVFMGGDSFTGSTLRLGSAFGDSLTNSSALQGGIFTDSYGRAYAADYSAQVTKAAPMPSLNFVRGSASKSVQFMQAGLSPAMALSQQTQYAGARLEAGKPIYFKTSAPMGTQFTYTEGLGMESGFGFSQQANAAGQLPTISQGTGSGFLSLMGDAASGSLAAPVSGALTLRTGFAVRGAEEDPMRLDPTQDTGSRMAYMAELGYAVQTSDKLRAGEVGLRFGAVQEDGSALDSRSAGAFSMGEGANTQFVGAYAHLPVAQDVALFANYETGWSKFSGEKSNGIVQDLRNVRAESFALGVSMHDALQAGDKLSFTFSQPLRVVSARADLVLPVGVDAMGNVLRSRTPLSLTPTGRQLDAELGYAMGIGEREEVQMKALLSREPGHDAKAGAEAVFGVRYSKKF